MLPKAERCAGGNILAMRCRFALKRGVTESLCKFAT
jgi:hypothetical protein